MGINTRSLGRERTQQRDQQIDTQVRIYTNTRRQTSTSEISLDRTPYGACRGQQERSSAISDLDEFVPEEEDYPVVDYVLVIHATKSTISR